MRTVTGAGKLVGMTSNQYDDKTPVDEPIEIRLRDRHGSPYVSSDSTYVGMVDRGVIVHTLTGGGVVEAMSNVQSKGGHYPRKAVPGWQAEMVAWFRAGLRDIVEIR